MDLLGSNTGLKSSRVSIHMNNSSLLAFEWPVNYQDHLVKKLVLLDSVDVHHASALTTELIFDVNVLQKFAAKQSGVLWILNKNSVALSHKSIVPHVNDVLIDALDDSLLVVCECLSVGYSYHVIDLNCVASGVSGHCLFVHDMLLVDITQSY